LKTVLLPSTGTTPLPSPQLVLEDGPCGRDDIALSPWDIRTLSLGPASALDFLISLPGTPPRGVAFGSSLRFWVEAAKLTIELLARQCFLPALKKEERGKRPSFRATWEALISEGDARRMQVLANSMPPVCRALPNGDRPPLPSDLVSSFVDEAIDAFVRASLASSPLLPRRSAQAASLPERWLRALYSDEPRVEGIPRALGSFSEELEAWLNQAQPAPSDTPFRTCFRLDPPDDDSTQWRVSFYLQASDDRSLLVPAETVWVTRSGVATFLKRRFENPQERLLADLGKASRVFPAIDDSLKTARPVAVTLDAERAYAFLRQSAPLLEQSGFGVLLPAWWQKPAARLSARLKLRPKGNTKTASGLMGLDSMVDYDWQIALGDEVLSREEFDKLADLKVPLVKVRGQWVELKPEQIEAAADFFRKRHGNSEMRMGEALRVGLGREISEVGLPVDAMEAEGWIGELLDKLGGGAKMSEVSPPPTFNGELRPYQVKGLSWLAFLSQLGLGACLADDMGLGKTIELIALMLHERAGRARKSSPGPTLLVCPMSVVGNWQKEI